MRKITIIILFIFSLFFSVSVFCQTYDQYDDEIRRVQFIIRGGVNLSTLTKVNPAQTGKEKVKVGYNVGILADTYISGGIFVQTGALLTTKGASIKGAPMADGTTAKMSLETMYVQVPLLFAYKIAVGNGDERFNLALGPYFAYGVGGELKGADLAKVDAFGNEGICKKPSVGICIEVQYETPKLFFFFGTDIGFTKVMKKTALTDNFRSKIKNTGFNLGVGYKL